MYADVTLHDDTTTHYLRWEITFDGNEVARLKALGGPLSLRLAATHYVDDAGKHYEATEVEVPIYPHAGRRNQGQAKFTDWESRRSFLERLQGTLVARVSDFVAEARPGSVPVEGHVIAA